MPYYRAYIIGPDGHFANALDLDCEHDAAAIESAKQFVNGHDIEVWQGGRMVTRLTTSDPE